MNELFRFSRIFFPSCWYFLTGEGNVGTGLRNGIWNVSWPCRWHNRTELACVASFFREFVEKVRISSNFFALAPTFAQLLDRKRLLGRLIVIRTGKPLLIACVVKSTCVLFFALRSERARSQNLFFPWLLVLHSLDPIAYCNSFREIIQLQSLDYTLVFMFLVL